MKFDCLFASFPDFGLHHSSSQMWLYYLEASMHRYHSWIFCGFQVSKQYERMGYDDTRNKHVNYLKASMSCLKNAFKAFQF